MKRRTFLTLSTAAVVLPGLAPAEIATPRAAQAALAREAFVYLYPMVENYLSLYQYGIDTTSDQFKAPINQPGNVARVFTPDDTGVVTPNSDTPYTFLVMDLRTEPLVLHLPQIEDTRYYSVQLIDLYSHNAGYLGTRVDGNGGGVFLIAGPDWDGEVPEGVTRVVRMGTQIGFALYRTQLFEPEDIAKVVEIQKGYVVQPLSAFAGTDAPPAAASVDWPTISRDEMAKKFWSYGNFLLQFAPPLSWERDLRESFALIGVGAASEWPGRALSAEEIETVAEASKAALGEIAERLQTLTTSNDLFGSPEEMRGRYLDRAMGAMGGLYGNSAVEALYPIYAVDAEGKPLDAAQHDYVMRIPSGQLPPVGAFWSLTMYDAKTRFLVRNPLDRYLINSPMLPGLKVEPNGDILLYLQKDSPGADLESNWLPTPDGPFAAVLRLYLPKQPALDGSWVAPAITARG